MKDILHYLVKDMTLTKSKFWHSEDERRLVCRNVDKPLYIPLDKALKTVYLGVSFNNLGRELIDSVFKTLNGLAALSMLIYQHNRFGRWGIKVLSDGQVRTCALDDIKELPN